MSTHRRPPALAPRLPGQVRRCTTLPRGARERAAGSDRANAWSRPRQREHAVCPTQRATAVRRWLDGRELPDVTLAAYLAELHDVRPRVVGRLDGGRRNVIPREADRLALARRRADGPKAGSARSPSGLPKRCRPSRTALRHQLVRGRRPGRSRWPPANGLSKRRCNLQPSDEETTLTSCSSTTSARSGMQSSSFCAFGGIVVSATTLVPTWRRLRGHAGRLRKRRWRGASDTISLSLRAV